MSNEIETTKSEWRAAPAAVKQPLVAVGDIHGRALLLRALQLRLAREAKDIARLVYLGDLIDPHPRRDIGPHDCADVLDAAAVRVRGFKSIEYLAGNHDAFFLIALDAARRGVKLPWEDHLWVNQGGAETAVAWGIEGARDMNEIEIAKEIRERMTPAQMAVFEAMRVYVEHDAYLLVHAGFEPHVPLDRQMERADILEFPSAWNEQQHPLWMRFQNGTDAAPAGRILIHGHNSTRRPILGRKRICIDTGAKYGGPLTALEIVGDRMRLHQAWPAGMDATRWHKDGLR
jgi:serine/threonine protein phosphatase 1